REWRAYMGRHRQNLAYQYHNGGCWPLVGGFWAISQGRYGSRRAAYETLVRLAQGNGQNGWGFKEGVPGRTGAACGMPRQSWSAAAYLLAYDAVMNLNQKLQRKGAKGAKEQRN